MIRGCFLFSDRRLGARVIVDSRAPSDNSQAHSVNSQVSVNSQASVNSQTPSVELGGTIPLSERNSYIHVAGGSEGQTPEITCEDDVTLEYLPNDTELM